MQNPKPSMVTRRSRLAVAVMGMSSFMIPAQADVPATIRVEPSVLTPYTSGGCARFATGHQCYEITGTAPAGASITVIVNDNLMNGYSVQGQTTALTSDDPAMDEHAGDWTLPGLDVTNLGTHGPVPSTLTYTVIARANGITATDSTLVTKIAATPNDTFPPNAYPNSQPPRYWSPFVQGTDFSGWERREADGLSHCVGTSPPSICNNPPLSGPSGADPYHSEISGTVYDNDPSAYGVASEISDVEIVVTRDSDRTVLTDVHAAYRGLGNDGTAAWYSLKLNLGDYVTGQTYDWIVMTSDAAGNIADSYGGQFTILP